MKELDDYSIEELLIYCTAKAEQERVNTDNIRLKRCCEQVYYYAKKAALEFRKYELEEEINEFLESN